MCKCCHGIGSILAPWIREKINFIQFSGFCERKIIFGVYWGLVQPLSCNLWMKFAMVLSQYKFEEASFSCFSSKDNCYHQTPYLFDGINRLLSNCKINGLLHLFVFLVAIQITTFSPHFIIPFWMEKIKLKKSQFCVLLWKKPLHHH